MKVWRNTAAAVLCWLMVGQSWANSSVDEPTEFRDWQVENPMTAGITKGMTLGLFPGSKYGEGAVVASEYDPFGMSTAVYKQVAVHGQFSHQVGQAIGLGFWGFTLGGVFYRLLHKLKVDALEKTHAS